MCSYVVTAGLPEGRSHVVSYGYREVLRSADGIEGGIRNAVLELLEEFEDGFAVAGTGEVFVPDCYGVDAGYQPEAVYSACDRLPGKAWPIEGLGRDGAARARCGRTRKGAATCCVWGRVAGWRGSRRGGGCVIEQDADHWKSVVHSSLTVPVAPDGATLQEESREARNSSAGRSPVGSGALTLWWSENPLRHLKLAKHYLAEYQEERFEPSRGTVVVWQKKGSQQNHFFDGTYMGQVLIHLWRAGKLRPMGAAPSGGGVTTAGADGLAEQARGAEDGGRAGGWFASDEPGCPDCGCKDVRLGRVIPYWNRTAIACVCRNCGKRFTIEQTANGCPVCGSGNTKVTHTDGRIRRCRCRDCGVRFKLTSVD